MKLSHSNFLSVALYHTGLLIDQIVCGDDKYNLFAFRRLIFIIKEIAAIIHPFLFQLLGGKFCEVVMRLAEETLDKHKGDVGLSSASLDEDDRSEGLILIEIAFWVVLLKTPLKQNLFYNLLLVSVGVLYLGLVNQTRLGFVIGNDRN